MDGSEFSVSKRTSFSRNSGSGFVEEEYSLAQSNDPGEEESVATVEEIMDWSQQDLVLKNQDTESQDFESRSSLMHVVASVHEEEEVIPSERDDSFNQDQNENSDCTNNEIVENRPKSHSVSFVDTTEIVSNEFLGESPRISKTINFQVGETDSEASAKTSQEENTLKENTNSRGSRSSSLNLTNAQKSEDELKEEMKLAASKVYQGDFDENLVLLDNISDEYVAKVLKDRMFRSKYYTYIGPVLIAVNPFEVVPGLYDVENLIPNYRGKFFYEAAPHVYSIAEAAYSSLQSYHAPQCVIVAGESGAGKTETCKHIMQYISAVSGGEKEIAAVNRKILKTNPILEAFGNARTLRNNNSSRFGKYFEISFNYNGDPVGGSIQTYLLEKSRVAGAAVGERSFHIFYQLTMGADSHLKEKLQIKDPHEYRYLSKSETYSPLSLIENAKSTRLNSMDDWIRYETGQLKNTHDALVEMSFKENEIEEIFSLLSAILWIGEIDFVEENEYAQIEDMEPVHIVANLLRVDPTHLASCFLKRESHAAREKISRSHTIQEARYTRESLAKEFYSRIFLWIVELINRSIYPGSSAYKNNQVGVLDIYGFEIFFCNSFEQFCINYVNEKLQQIFIERTLRAEQEEYASEGISWQQIEFFDNKNVCDMIENSRGGIIALLNETCSFPQGNDLMFADKLNSNLQRNSFYRKASLKDVNSARKRNPSLGDRSSGIFFVKHYAGDVEYTIDGFVDKNRDLVWPELIQIGRESKLSICLEMFPAEDPRLAHDSKKPMTAASQFKDQVFSLSHTLQQCNPHYIRCIKPNDGKLARVFDDNRVIHQIRYLGLVEIIHVRKSGCAFRQTFREFIDRNKMLSPRTWPMWRGDAKVGVKHILDAAGLVEKQDYLLGLTKVFIKEAASVFRLDGMRSENIISVVLLTQSFVRGQAYARWYMNFRTARLLQSWARSRIRVNWVIENRKATYICSSFRTCVVLKWKSQYRTASLLQSAWRMHACRVMYHQHRSATLIQSVPRSKFAWLRFHFFGSASIIQSQARGNLARRWLTRTKAVITLQRVWRGSVVLNHFKSTRAAMKIQELKRSKIDGKEALQWFIDTRAAIRIQAFWKGRVKSDWYWWASNGKRLREYVEAFYLWKRAGRYQQETNASEIIQGIYKAKQARELEKQYTAAVILQKIFRRSSCVHLFKNHQSATLIQTASKAYRSLCIYRESLAAICIQRLLREKLSKQLARKIKLSDLLGRSYRHFVIKRPYIQQRDKSLQLFHRLKPRRRETLALLYTGIYTPEYLTNPEFKSVIGESDSIVFMDHIIKVSESFQNALRLLVMTEKLILEIEVTLRRNGSEKFEVHHKMDVSDIEKISLSPFIDNLFVLHFARSSDRVLESPRKSEIITQIVMLKTKIDNIEPPVDIISEISYKNKKGYRRLIGFQLEDENVALSKKSKSDATLDSGPILSSIIRWEKDTVKKKYPSMIAIVNHRAEIRNCIASESQLSKAFQFHEVL